MAGKHDEPTDQRHENFYISNLRFAASRLAEENIIGVIEPINKYAVPGYYLHCFDHALKVIKTVNHCNLKLMVDLYHLQHIRGNITRSLEDFTDYIGHVQIAQTPGRGEPDTDGEVNLKYVLSTLENVAGYHDWVGCEYRPVAGTKDGLKWIKDFGYDL